MFIGDQYPPSSVPSTPIPIEENYHYQLNSKNKFHPAMFYSIPFQIKPFLAEYLYARYAGNIEEGILHLPPHSYLGRSLHELLCPRPYNAPARETGNVCLRLTSLHRGPSPSTYNYLTQANRRIFESRAQHLLHTELFERMLTDRHRRGISYIESIRCFLLKYQIDSISEEGLMKAFYRWRKGLSG